MDLQAALVIALVKQNALLSELHLKHGHYSDDGLVQLKLAVAQETSTIETLRALIKEYEP